MPESRSTQRDRVSFGGLWLLAVLGACLVLWALLLAAGWIVVRVVF